MGPSPQPPKESAPNKHLSFQQLEACFASLPNAIVVWDWTGKILFLNTAAYTLFEVPASDSWVGMSAQQFFQRYEWWDEQQRPFVFAPWLLDQTTLKEETGSCFSDPQPFVLGLPSHRKVFLELLCSLVLGADPKPIGRFSVFHEEDQMASV
ncbi:PAS domain-containing protein [Ktedonobacter racemifer]|uniref:PAS fold domain protein n=1 Tax=Ktedonobacter racemifer DSM 44963 TaxID=485913 RepID=D6U866_KTERA|nr:PAS domain-containing protein [Ktedonobacter racemifer]EFH80077.1 PAS fold domain protein [Ktedonobacter racemifer DSM 44963]